MFEDEIQLAFFGVGGGQADADRLAEPIHLTGASPPQLSAEFVILIIVVAQFRQCER